MLQRAVELSMPAVNAAKAADKDLLRQVLPPKVAEALKAGRKVEPETFSHVTIFFSCVSLPSVPSCIRAVSRRLFAAVTAEACSCE